MKQINFDSNSEISNSKQSQMPNFEDIKFVIHLCGEQTIPIFLSAIQFPITTRHLLVSTKKCIKEGQKPVLIVKGALFNRRQISATIENLGEEDNAYDFQLLGETFQKKLQDALKEYSPNQICMDVTGGTKPMAISAWVMARRAGVASMYLDTPNRQCRWFMPNEEFPTTPLQTKMSLEDFPDLCGTQTQFKKPPILPNQNDLDFLIRQRDALKEFTEELQKVENRLEKEGKIRHGLKVKDIPGEYSVALEKMEKNMGNDSENWRRFKESDFFRSLRNEDEQLRFLVGAWFEYYTFVNLRNCVGDNKLELNEIQMNVRAQNTTTKLTDQEFDIVYTDGFSFVIVECKTRPINQDDIHRLNDISKTYSGALGQAALAVSLPAGMAIGSQRERLEKIRNLTTFCGVQGIQMLGKSMMDFLKLGTQKIYGEGAPEQE